MKILSIKKRTTLYYRIHFVWSYSADRHIYERKYFERKTAYVAIFGIPLIPTMTIFISINDIE